MYMRVCMWVVQPRPSPRFCLASAALLLAASLSRHRGTAAAITATSDFIVESKRVPGVKAWQAQKRLKAQTEAENDEHHSRRRG